MSLWSFTKPLMDWKWPFLTSSSTSKNANSTSTVTESLLGNASKPNATSLEQKERMSKDFASNNKNNERVITQEQVQQQEHLTSQTAKIADTIATENSKYNTINTALKEDANLPARHAHPTVHVKSHPRGYGYVNSCGHHTGRHKPNSKTYKPPYHDSGAYIELTHGLTYYELHGFEGESSEDKEIVVLLHGLSWWSFTWELMVPHLLKNNFRVITFDFYGRGLSAAPSHLKYDNQLLADQTYELLTKLKLGRKVTMIGFSMGGGVAGTFASVHHHMLNKLVLIGPAGTPVKMPLVAKVVALPVVGYCIYWAFAKLAMQRSLKTDQCKSDFAKPEKVAHLIGRYIDYSEWCIESKEGFFDALYSTTMNFPFSDLLNIYNKIPSSLPVLLLWGEKDHLIPVENHKLLLQAMPHAKFFSIPDAGHTCFLEEPDLTHKHITDFIGTPSQHPHTTQTRSRNRSHGPHFFHHKPVHLHPQHQPSQPFHTLTNNDSAPSETLVEATTATTPFSDTA